jgi:peptidoglycan/LPS O-acetylase OafA/YrhL
MAELPAGKTVTKNESALRRFLSLEPLDNRYPALHGMRVLAILSVIQYHITGVLGVEPALEIPEALKSASLSVFYGMDLFFVLSGFLIGSILLRSLELSGTQNIRRFYLRRAFRTFPSYWLVLTFLALSFPMNAMQRAQLPFEYVYLTNFVELGRHELVMSWGWSLALEEQFYLTVPILMFVLFRLRDDRTRIVALALLALSALVIRAYVYGTRETWTDFELFQAVYLRTYTRFDAIVAGILLAFIEIRYGKAIGEWLRHPFHRALLGIVAFGCLWLISVPNVFGDEHAQLMMLFMWGTLTSIMYLCLVPLMLHGDGTVQRFLSRPIFRRLATVGYGVYLVHIPLIDHVALPLVLYLDEQGYASSLLWFAAFALASVLSFVVGYLLHILVEKPSLWLRDRIAG